MIATIIKYDWRILQRNKGLIPALLVFLCIGLFCLQQGRSLVRFQQTAIDSVLSKKQKNHAQVKSVFDTLRLKKGMLSEIGDPYTLERRLQDVATRKINPLAVLSIGQSDMLSPMLSTQFNRQIFKNQLVEFYNPEKLMSGNLDVAFFVLFLFPLLFIALVYNTRSEDQEKGILPILAVQTSSTNLIVFSRLLLRWSIACLPFLSTALIAYVLLADMPGFSTLQWAAWWGAALLYFIFWLAIAAVLMQFRLSSLINAISFTGIWVTLLIAIPGILNTVFNYRYPTPLKSAVAAYRDFTSEAWDKPFEEQYAFIVKEYPDYKKIKISSLLDSMKFKTFSYVLMAINKEKELYFAMDRPKQQLIQAEEKSFWINPIGGLMRYWAGLSEVRQEDQRQFETTVLKYREQKLRYLFEKFVTQEHFTKQDFQAIPVFKAAAQQSKVFHVIYPMLLLTVVLMAWAYIGIRQKS
jgi:ABC-2 type transport system permease protein